MNVIVADDVALNNELNHNSTTQDNDAFLAEEMLGLEYSNLITELLNNSDEINAASRLFKFWKYRLNNSNNSDGHLRTNI